MTWMLWLLTGATEFEAVSIGVMLAKSAAGALSGWLLKRVWRTAMGETNNMQCMIKGCGGVRGSALKGLCMQCYKKAKAKVEAGHVTWDILAEKGLCEGKTDPFSSAYDKAMEDN